MQFRVSSLPAKFSSEVRMIILTNYGTGKKKVFVGAEESRLVPVVETVANESMY